MNDFEKDEAEQNNPTNYLSFIDSWKSNSFELGAAAAITGGAMYLGLTGRSPDLKRGAMNAGKNAVNAVNSYLSKALPTGPRNIKNIIVNTARQYSNRKPVTTDADVAYFESLSRRGNPNINTDEMYRRAVADYQASLLKWEQEGRVGPKPSQSEFVETVRSKMTEDARKQEVDATLNGITSNPANKNQNAAGGLSGGISNFIGAALTGAGFGAGITAFHGIENAVRDPNTPQKYQKRDALFDSSGSHLKNLTQSKDNRSFQNRGDHMPRRMITKEASVFRHVYDNVAGVAENTPKAVASGLGFTGVSLATAALLKNNPHLLRGNNPAAGAIGAQGAHGEEGNNPRIIIELGPDQNAAQSLSRLANAASEHLQKQANVKTYFQSLLGHPTELRQLNQRISGEVGSYHDEAADLLRHQNVADLAKQKYGPLYDINEKEFAKNLFESKANELKRRDIAQRETLKDQIAKARLLTAGGVGAVGTGLAAAAYANREKGGIDHV